VIIAGKPVALLATLTLAPLTVPGVVGSNVTVSVVDCPGVRIVPFETPLAVNPAPATVTLETVTLEFPLFVNVAVSGVGLFTLTVPKLNVVGFAVNPRVPATPVPLKGIDSEEDAPLAVSTMDPVALVAETGVKMALSIALAPAAIVVDVVIPELLNPAPVVFTCENVRVELPPL
jgi:hypothetical protein